MIRRLPAPLLALLLPGVIAVGGVVATAILAAGSTGPIAVHWDVAGVADGFAEPWTVVAATAIAGIALATLLGLILLLARAEPGPTSRAQKAIAAIAAGATAFVTALGVWTLASQHDGGPAPAVGGGFVIGALSALVAGVAAWFLLPPAEPRRPRDPAPAAPVALGATERAVWTGTARMPRPAIAGIGAGVLALLALVAVAVFTTDGAAWPVLVIPVAIGILLFAFSAYTVRVDDSGLLVRAMLGVPVWRIRADEIAAAGVVEVAPIAEFGGWGVRLGRNGRTGVITRGGEALQVRRRSGRALVVTVDDAGTAAALLSAVAERAEPRG